MKLNGTRPADPLILLGTAFALLTGMTDSQAKSGRKIHASFKKTASIPVAERASVAINGETGEILECNSCMEQRAQASLTKIVTAMVGFDTIRDRHLPMDGLIVLPDAKEIGNQGAVTLQKKGVPAGSFRTRDYIYSAASVLSAADATMAISQDVCGTPDCIVDLMNRKAALILKFNDPANPTTHFANPHGMPDKNQYSTAYDFAKITQYAVLNYPEIVKFFSQTSFDIGNRSKPIAGHNALLATYKRKNALGFNYRAAEMGKTGLFRNPKGQGLPAGSCLTISAVWNNYRVIAVDLGDLWAGSRDKYTADLLDRGFAKLESTKAPKTVKMPLHFPSFRPDPPVAPEEDQSPLPAGDVKAVLAVTPAASQPESAIKPTGASSAAIARPAASQPVLSLR